MYFLQFFLELMSNRMINKKLSTLYMLTMCAFDKMSTRTLSKNIHFSALFMELLSIKDLSSNIIDISSECQYHHICSFLLF